MEEVIPTIEELQEQIENLTKQDEVRQQDVQMQSQQVQQQSQQVQQQLQNVVSASINTMGQIRQLEEVLESQRQERHQLEGMMRAFSMVQPAPE